MRAERCSRPRTNGKPCLGRAVEWYGTTPDPLACGHHLTDIERAAQDLAIRRKYFDPAFARMITGDPACWHWPIELTVRLEVAAAIASGKTDDTHLDVLDWWQQDRCAVCGKSGNLAGRFVEDHDHRTGLIRGILCNSCNVIEPNWPDDGRNVFDRYRARPATVVLGLTLRYRNKLTGELAQPEEPLSSDWTNNALRGIGL